MQVKGLRGRKALKCKYYQKGSKESKNKSEKKQLLGELKYLSSHTLKLELTLSVKRWAVLVVGGAACSYACFELLRLICSYIISYGFAPVFLLEIPILVYGLIFPPALLGWLLYKARSARDLEVQK